MINNNFKECLIPYNFRDKFNFLLNLGSDFGIKFSFYENVKNYRFYNKNLYTISKKDELIIKAANIIVKNETNSVLIIDPNPLNMKDFRINFSNQKIQSILQNLSSNTFIQFIVHPKDKNFINNDTFDQLKRFHKKSIFYWGEPLILKFSNKSDIFVLSDDFAYNLKLKHIINGQNQLSKNILPEVSEKSDFSNFLENNKDSYILMGVPHSHKYESIFFGRQKYLSELMGVNKKIYLPEYPDQSQKVNFLIQWGAEPGNAQAVINNFNLYQRKPLFYVEDGFIRSINLWTDENEPTLSVFVDSKNIYYNSNEKTELESFLNSNFEIKDVDINRVKKLIQKIIKNKISKYNYAPEFDFSKYLRPGKTILIVDQKADDMSIKYGLAEKEDFNKMLIDALNSDAENILIKIHPCALEGNKNLANFRISELKKLNDKRINLVSFDVNPYSLIAVSDEIKVVVSGMGFESLLYGKQVTCYGVPFYANWGITNDKKKSPRRTRNRSLEEIFYAFYIRQSRYFDPINKRPCELEDLIESIIEIKNN